LADHAGAQQVVDVQNADRLAVVDDEQHGDRRRSFISARASAARASGGTVSLGARVITSPAVWSIRPVHVAAQVAVGDQAGQRFRRRRDHADAPKRFSVITSRASRIGVASTVSGSSSRAVHQVADRAQHGAQLAAGVEDAEVAGVKPRRSSRATARASPRAICRVVEVVGALTSAVASGASGSSSTTVGGPAQRAVGAAVMRDQRDREALGVGQDVGQLADLAGFRQRQHDVAGPTMPRSPWLASAGVDEHGRRAGGGQGGGDLARHVARLADAGADHPALGVEQGLDRRTKLRPGRGHGRQGLGLGGQHPAADGDRVEAAHWVTARSRVGGAPGLAAARGRAGSPRRRSRAGSGLHLRRLLHGGRAERAGRAVAVALRPDHGKGDERGGEQRPGAA
jgi:hypothetical protein